MRRLFQSILARLSRYGAVQKILGNFSWLMAEKVISMTAAILITIPMTRILGPAEFGAYNYVLALVAIVTPLVSLGLNHIVTKELMDRPRTEGRVLGTVMWLRIAGGLLGLVGIWAWVLVAPPSDPGLVPYIIALAAAGIPNGFLFLQYWFLSRNEAAGPAIAEIVNTVIFNVARLVLLLMGGGFEWMMILAIAQMAGSGVLIFIAYRRVRPPGLTWSWDFGLARQLLGRSWPLILSALTAAIYLRIDIVMLNEMVSPEAAGQYSAAARLSEVWYFLPTLLMTAAFPALLKSRSASQEVYRARLQDGLDLLAALGTMLALFVTFTAPFIITILYGEAFRSAALILAVHIWAGVFVFMRALVSKWMIAENLYIVSFLTHGFGALANVLLNLYLIPRWGGVGSAVATLISYALASYVALLAHPRGWEMFRMMTYSLAWPRRAPDVMRVVAALRRDHRS